ncbi:phage head spike fiber domain-containing protein [Brevundimonas sp.]|uniref:phage head spike fiber domain-containing protein n=1 Tax=Brevundimonas sp. TaxID=1871086 RepID=UPI002ABC3441|nr:hypothetical protein [Brevundimonas sp.]MDZ4363229.1 hypothetical protein [Brevundimonas sp.]
MSVALGFDLDQLVLRGAAEPGVRIVPQGARYERDRQRHAGLGTMPGGSFIRTGAGTAWTAAGTLETFASGVPRITDQGLLIEGPRTNQLNLFNADPVDVSGLAPYGGATVSVVERSALIGAAGLAQVCPAGRVFRVVTTGNDQGVSIGTATTGAMMTSASAWVAVESGSGAGVCLEGHGPVAVTSSAALTRVAVNGVMPGASTRMRLRSQGGTSSFVFILPQLETGPSVSSPIVTTGAAATRGGDVALLGQLALSPPYTISCAFEPDAAAWAAGVGQYVLSLSDVGDVSRVIMLRASATTVNLEIYNAGGRICLINHTVVPGQTNRVAVRVAVDDMRSAVNGVLGAHDTAGSPEAVSLLGLGCRAINGGNALCGGVSEMTIRPGAASDAELIALTQ